jgi:NitT/TauT family transport system substrate-binding protein
MKMRMLVAISWVVVTGAIFSGCKGTAKNTGTDNGTNSPQTVRVGTNRALGTVVPFVATKQGYFAQKGVQVDVVDFADGSPVEAFAAGQLDIALLGIAPSAIWQGQGVNLKVVAAANGGGHVLLTRSDSGITTLQGLKNKKVATPKPGTVTDTLFRAHLMEEIAHLDPEKDVQIVSNLAPGDMATALFVSREIDAAITWEPYASEAEIKFRNAKVLYDSAVEWRKAHPNSNTLYPVNVVIARQSFIDNHPAELRNFLAAYVQAIQFIDNNPDQANKIIGDELQLDPAVVAKARQRIDYTWHVDPDASLTTLQWSKQAGYLKEIPAAEKLFDLRYLPAR